jgi:hypothetical protein
LKLLPFSRWTLADVNPPWDGESLYEILKVAGPKATLPERPKRSENELGWVAGALDGVTGHHFNRADGDQTQNRIKSILGALTRLLRDSSQEAVSALYKELQADVLLSIADALQQRLKAKVLVSETRSSRLAEVGRYFATRSADREGTKFGILLLELSGDDSDRPVLETLALHDEFTLYAALALCKLSSEPESVLWNLAQKVHGWGRVQVVERLDGTQNLAIRSWMLRDGFRNDIMDEYLAGICARTGKLHEALSAKDVDRVLLDGAAGIIKALLCGGPADSIDDYPEGPIAIQEYLRQVIQASDLSLEHLLCIARLRYFLSEAAGWEDRFSKGWTSDVRDEMLSTCTRLMGRPDWQVKIDSALHSPDNRAFYEADAAAQALGIETRTIHFERVRSEPLKSSSWYRLLQQTNEDQIEEILAFAAEALPLDEIASGPADSLGLGEKYAAHSALDWILQDLKRFPGHGWKLIEIGLQSPVTRNRNMALNALLEWPRPSWPEQAPSLLARLSAIEPNQKLRERLQPILGAGVHSADRSQ